MLDNMSRLNITKGSCRMIRIFFIFFATGFVVAAVIAVGRSNPTVCTESALCE